ncbi:hypothetical protein RUM44_003537 [Polyplax serrata]|uniref:Uncharacterized protein n=1 Tax=Polyplax serrata TaxID=468196 RepID=A0ABR1AGS8_POLSC
MTWVVNTKDTLVTMTSKTKTFQVWEAKKVKPRRRLEKKTKSIESRQSKNLPKRYPRGRGDLLPRGALKGIIFMFQAKLETKALKAKRPGFTDDRYNETSYYIENVCNGYEIAEFVPMSSLGKDNLSFDGKNSTCEDGEPNEYFQVLVPSTSPLVTHCSKEKRELSLLLNLL